MDGNYLKIYRSLLKWEWYTEVNTFKVFIHCLLRANYKEQQFRGQTIPAGGFVTSLAHMAKDTGLSVDQVRTALKHLELTKEITKQTNNRYTLIIVNNWENFQGQSQAETQTDTKRDTKRIPNKSQTNPKQIPTIEERKERKESKEGKNNIYRASKDAEVVYFPADEKLDSLFKEFLAMRKQIKKPATEKAVKLLITRLDTLSKGDRDVACEIVEEALLKNWLNFYELKKDKPKDTQQRPTGLTIDDLINQEGDL